MRCCWERAGQVRPDRGLCGRLFVPAVRAGGHGLATTTLEMRSAWGEPKSVQVMPVALARVGSPDRLLVYLLDSGSISEAAVGPGWILGSATAGTGVVGDENALTSREIDVLRLVALGWSNERIGDELGVTLNTVRTHLANLRGKLGAETRLEAVMAGLRLRLLELR